MDNTGTTTLGQANTRRQLIVCCDGTNNNLTGRRRDTNVSQLCELLEPEKNNQRLFYDPGVGNAGSLPEATLVERIQQQYQRLSGLAYGSGIYENIAEAYRFLMHNWKVDDDIFLFGFSRGAFTARSLGGLVTQFGILRPGMEVMVPTLLHAYFRERDTESRRAEFKRVRDQIRQMFTSDAARDAHVWFVGVWDTVASVGTPLPFLRQRITATPTIVRKNFDNVRQALALDEFRATFKPRPYLIEKGYDYKAARQTIAQEWFAGSHCDVGGGYLNAQAGLSRQAFLWMVAEAGSSQCLLRIREELLGANGLPDAAKICHFLDERGEPSGARARLAHSEIYDTAWWALGGMSVRDPAEWLEPAGKLDSGRVVKAPPTESPIESPTVAADALKFPSGTVWRKARSWRPVLVAALLSLVFWTMAGAFLLGPDKPGSGSFWHVLQNFFPLLPQLWEANLGFAQWQLGWTFAWQSMGAWEDFHSPVKAILADFLLIASYGCLLARGTGWAFAQIARLRHVGEAPPKRLNMLGQAGLVTILGDVSENLLTLLVIATSPNDFTPALPYLLGLLMTLASVAKWLGLAGCLALMAWGVASRAVTPRNISAPSQRPLNDH